MRFYAPGRGGLVLALTATINNLVPTADAGPDLEICGEQDGALVHLSAAASSDLDGPQDLASFAWSSPSGFFASGSEVDLQLPVGAHLFDLTVTDQKGAASTDTVVVNVAGGTSGLSFVPPDVTISSCVDPDIGVALAADGCGGSVEITNDAPSVFPLGETIVTWVATASNGATTEATQRVTAVLGDDPSCCPAGSNVILGTSNDDNLIGTAGADCILSFGAQDHIDGLGGDDYLSAGDGDDVVVGGSGDDWLFGGSGQDQLDGGSGNDVVRGDDGDDVVLGAGGSDRLLGGQGQDQLNGGEGNDQLRGEGGDDTLDGGPGDDLLAGGGLHDTCLGGSGSNLFVACEQTPDSPGAQDACSDGTTNGSETDLDCGGSDCSPCAEQLICIAGGDCSSGVCEGGLCFAGSASLSSVQATLTVTGDWGQGYCVQLEAHNPTSEPIPLWSVLVNLNASSVYTSWNGMLSGAAGVVEVRPGFDWNRVLAPGETDGSIGFCANRDVPDSGKVPFVVVEGL